MAQYLGKKAVSVVLGAGMIVGMGISTPAFANTIDNTEAEFVGYFNNNKYQVFHDQMTWSEAKAACEEQGGHLVTITSQEEQDFLETLIPTTEKYNYWIGAFAPDAPGYDVPYEWITGEVFDFTNWGNTDKFDQPDHDFNGTEAFVGIVNTDRHYANQFEWNDYRHNDFREPFGYICEWEQAVPENPDTPVNPIEGDYVIFSNSSTDRLKVQGWQTTVNGNIYSGSDFNSFDQGEFYVNGNLDSVGTITTGGYICNIENPRPDFEAIEIPDWSEAILGNVAGIEAQDDIFFSNGCDVTEGLNSNGDIKIQGNLANVQGYIVADGDITIEPSEFKTTAPTVIYSKNGNIQINGNVFDFEGIIYAPNGHINITTNQTNITGRVYGDVVYLQTNQLTVGAGQNDFDLVK